MNKRTHSKLWLYLSGAIFSTVFLIFLLVSAIWILLYRLEWIAVDPQTRHVPIVLLCLGSVLLGTVLACLVGRRIIGPMQKLSDAFTALSKGDFSVRLSTDEKIEEIRELATHFNAMTHDLSHMETLRSDFVANVSHEFKTPIATIEGYATLLQNPNLTREKHDHYVQIILENARRLSDMSSSILTLSKLENQELILDNRWFRLDEQIRRCILLLEGKWACKELVFDLELPKQMYYGSEALLAQVWSNLLDNAIRYSPRAGTIQVHLHSAQAYVLVSVSDHGEGMSQEVCKHIFEKFYQGDPSRQAEGNGLGLALVKRIVELSRGDVSVHSQVGAGAVFSVRLPL